ncbi:MAG: DUF4280 domain-containing protein [Defluviitaleaceae bacterium]|nr:DUF4280 domain-containing protein [Defluviitaleaceae bacterium]
MGICVCNGAQLKCSFGTAPSILVVLPTKKVISTTPAATIMDHVSMVNILPFAMCTNPANPATVRPPPVMFSPAPCIPMTPAPWVPGCVTCLIGGEPALESSCTLLCNWGGIIEIIYPGQSKTIVS